MQKFRKALTMFDDYYDMLADRVRMDAYEAAITKAVQPGDVVIDLGAGLGILSFLAVRAGASKVYAIEKSDSVELARVVAHRNGLEDKVEFVDKNSKEFQLAPDDRADIIISETLGSFGLDENTVDFTIDARERLLKPGGRILPQALRMWLSPVEATRKYDQVSFWRDISGIDYSAAVEEILGRMNVAPFKSKQLLAAPQVFHQIDMRKVTTPALERHMEFEVTRKGTIHGMAGWFDALLVDGIGITTSPDAPRTHWEQAFFPFRAAIQVIPGDVLQLHLRVNPLSERADDTAISYDYFCTQNSEPVTVAAKVGRNEPCPCGSGNKYKRCHGAAT